MTLKDMIDKLRLASLIEIRDRDNFRICITASNAKGVIPYLDYDVIEWFPLFESFSQREMFCVLIDEEGAADD